MSERDNDDDDVVFIQEMWRTRELTPSVREKVIYVAESEGELAYTFAFPVVNGTVSLKLLSKHFSFLRCCIPLVNKHLLYHVVMHNRTLQLRTM